MVMFAVSKAHLVPPVLRVRGLQVQANATTRETDGLGWTGHNRGFPVN